MSKENKNFDADAFIARRKENEAKLTEAGVYAPDMEHDACGVGFVAARDGKPSRAVVDCCDRGFTGDLASWCG
jgi:glutamate synthase (NADPH/NADH) large chain